jgi:hypothetical protein
MLPLHHASEQRRAYPHRHIIRHDRNLEDGLKQRPRADGVKLGPVNLLASRLEQACLEKLDRGCDSE